MSAFAFAHKLSAGMLLVVLLPALLAGCATRRPAAPDVDTMTVGAIASGAPDVRAADERVVQANAQEVIARADLMPELALKGSYSAYAHDSTQTPPLTSASSAGLSLTMPLSRAIAGIGGVQSASASAAAEREARRSAEAGSLLQVVRAAAAHEKALQLLGVLDEQGRELRNFLGRQQSRVSAGLVSRSGLEQVRARMSALDSEIARARAELDAASAQLRAVAGATPFEHIRTADFAPLIPASADEAVEIAHTESPKLREVAWRETAAQHDVGSSIAQLGPDLSLSVNAATTAESFADGSNSAGDTVDVRLDLKVPLFDGGRGLARSTIKQSAYRQRAFEAQAARAEVDGNVRALFAQTESLTKILRFSQDRVAHSRRAYAGALEAERVGAKGLEQSLQAFNDWTDARTALAEANYQYVMQAHELLAEIGRIGQAYGLR